MDPKEHSKDDLDNHSNQLNDNNDAYWQSRGYDERPDDGEDDDDEDYDDSYESDDNAFDSSMSDDF